MPKLQTYFRRCHICYELTEGPEDDEVQRCKHCGKAFAKFQYFDDRYSPVQSDSHLRPVFADGEFEPVKGLTVHWTN